MVEPVTTAVLATGAVKVAGDFLAKAAEGSATKLGEMATEGASHGGLALWRKVKDAVTRRGAGRAVERFEGAPNDSRFRDALAIELEEALDAEPGLRDEVRALIDQLGGTRVVIDQTATQTGNDNASVQSAGNQNVVNVHGRRGS